ncbi:hypothetical protein D3C85_1450880 [compost metagenome]
MHALAGSAEGQPGGTVEQGLEVEIGALADQFEIEAVGRVEGFVAVEGEHLQIGVDAWNGQREMRQVGIQHALASILGVGEGGRVPERAPAFNAGISISCARSINRRRKASACDRLPKTAGHPPKPTVPAQAA